MTGHDSPVPDRACARRTAWPTMMRWGNVIELTGDAIGRAVLMAWLVALLPLVGAGTAGARLWLDRRRVAPS